MTILIPSASICCHADLDDDNLCAECGGNQPEIEVGPWM